MNMLKVVTVNLNGNAYQVDETGFDALHGYLEVAKSQLAQNPDCAEIMTDLEQAIADKCDTFLGANKNVVSAVEMAQIVKEMGPVEGATEDAPNPDAPDAASTVQTPTAPTRRLFRLPERGMLGGVCAGFAAYFNVDVVWVRLLFVLLTFITGVWLFVWLVMLFVMPRAQTPEDLALAHGTPFNAQEVINRAKKKYDEFSGAAADLGRKQWRRHEPTVKNAAADIKQGIDSLGTKMNNVRARTRARAPRDMDAPVGYGAQVAAGISLPVLSVLSAALLVVFLALLALVADTDSVFGWTLLPFMPQWLAVALVVVAYLIVAAPVGIARRASHRYANGGRHFGWASSLDGLLWIALVVVFAWGVYQFVPGVSEALANLFGLSGQSAWAML
ncbi:MAG: PspC domain-containing protein [Steroidobacteraceae bacterium]